MDDLTLTYLRALPRDRTLTLIGGTRALPFEAEGQTPHMVLWARADDFQVLATRVVGDEDERAVLLELLPEAMLNPQEPAEPALPRRVQVEDAELARTIRDRIARLGVEVSSRPLPMLDELRDSLTEFLALTAEKMTWKVGPEELRPLYAAAASLWRRAPWDYLGDEPPIALQINRHGVDTLYASILGAMGEVFGVAFYTSLAEYEKSVDLGTQIQAAEADPLMTSPPATWDWDSLTVMFSSSDEVDPGEVEAIKADNLPLASKDAIPGFLHTTPDGGVQLPNAEEVRAMTLALEALNRFCSRFAQRLSEADWPIATDLRIEQDGARIPVRVAIPPEGEPRWAPDPTVYRFRVTLQSNPDVWRVIDVRGDQTLDHLHYGIQEAFDWDDDHLYSFFMSGQAWDPSTEYARSGDPRPTHRARIGSLDLHPGQTFLYIFDYGDEWRHDVTLEGTVPDAPRGPYPLIVEEHGEAPMQYPDWEDEDDDWDEEDEDEDEEDDGENGEDLRPLR